MTKDRLAEFSNNIYLNDGGESGHQMATTKSQSIISKILQGGSKNYAIMTAEDEIEDIPLDDFIDDFQSISSKIRDNLQQFESNINKLKDIYIVVHQNNNDNTSKEASDKLQTLLKENNNLAISTKKLLDNMENSVDSLTPTELRMRDTVKSQQTRKFAELISTYQSLQTSYKNKMTKRVKKHIEIVHPDFTQEQIDQIVEDGNTAIFQQDILYDKGRDEAEYRLHYIQDRHRDIVQLERSIRELHELFVDMAFLVTEQGEMITQVGYNIGQARSYIQDSTKSLKEANKLQKKSRKRMCCIIFIIVIIIIVVIAVPVIVTTLKNST
jgi:t-SNARE complex subunit (syntaxin)